MLTPELAGDIVERPAQPAPGAPEPAGGIGQLLGPDEHDGEDADDDEFSAPEAEHGHWAPFRVTSALLHAPSF